MFTKATFFAALVAGASAVSPAAYGETPAGYGGDSYNSSSSASPVEPSTYSAPPSYPSSSSTPYSPVEPSTYSSAPPSYPTSSEPKSPVEPSTYSSAPPSYPTSYSSSSTEKSPEYPSTSSTTCTEETASTYSSSSSSVYHNTYPTTTSTWEYKPTGYSSSTPSSYYKTATSSDDSYTTATITGTKVITITSCAPTVTDCPAEKATHTYLSTTESVYTTYCPKSEASSYYNKPSSTKSVEKPTYPASYGTGVYTKSKPVPSGYSTSEVVYDKTLTYTLGHGASTTVITTTVKSTSTAYLTKTVYATKSKSEESPVKPTAPVYPVPSSESKGYTTIKSTSTITNFVTVYPSKTSGSPVGPSKSGEVCVPETVTVTQKETVYVTVPSASSTPYSEFKSYATTPLRNRRFSENLY